MYVVCNVSWSVYNFILCKVLVECGRYICFYTVMFDSRLANICYPLTVFCA